MDDKVQLFKDFWNHNYSYISLELDDEEIEYYVAQFATIAQACNAAADYLLAQGLSEVME
jgi:hypothetical protein